MDMPLLETEGFVTVRTRPDLSYKKPTLILSQRSLQFVRERSTNWSGIHRAGAAIKINALSWAWMLNAVSSRKRASMTCQGTTIAEISDPESDKDGIGINAIEAFTCSLTVACRVHFRFEAIIGGPIFGGGIPGADGLKLMAGFKYDRALFHVALSSIVHGRAIA